MLAYEKQPRSYDSVEYRAPEGIGPAVLMMRGRTTYQGTDRRAWLLADWSTGNNEHFYYVEVAAPADSRSASDVIDAYVAGEGAKPGTDLGTVPTDAEKTLASACGGTISVKATAAANAGMVDRVRATSAAISKLCEDADYKVAIAKLTELNFTASGAADTRIAMRGKAVDIALGSTPLNTPATVRLWLKDNLSATAFAMTVREKKAWDALNEKSKRAAENLKEACGVEIVIMPDKSWTAIELLENQAGWCIKYAESALWNLCSYANRKAAVVKSVKKGTCVYDPELTQPETLLEKASALVAVKLIQSSI